MTAESTGLSDLLADYGGGEAGESDAPEDTQGDGKPAGAEYRAAKVDAARAIKKAFNSEDPEALANALADFIDLCGMA